ncbi:MAG: M1 family metallopeptidase [Pyrinomonadaceae bacterium]|nr:M1 family metallopeptidase [Pyrinomonadaceae bacterium]
MTGCLVAFVLYSSTVAAINNSPGERMVKSSADVGALVGSDESAVRDFHSYSNPQEVRVRHVDLDLGVDFEQKILKGTATLTFEKVSQKSNALVLDTRALNISMVEASADGRRFSNTEFTLGANDPVLGAPLNISLPEGATGVRIHYATSPGASGLQWLGPQQTAGKQQPFLFTQSQAIHARSWIPLQDTPQVRVTYTAHVRTPSRLMAVMSAENNPSALRNGDYRFRMVQPIPSYLIALAVGDLRFRALGRRTGVYAEPPVIEKAAREFIDTEKMVEATERLYGPYRWGRYDLLVLPPSFPYGGMENPRLTFATPTVLAGDKSLVSLIAHELAHSWSGNLVTNATWSDFWLNEGFTTYIERRIIEAVYGRAREEMEAALGLRSLEEEMAGLEERDRVLHIDLKGRDPDAGSTGVPYEKGALFLRSLEETFGRARFDQFLKSYFAHFAFQSIRTEDFVSYLKANLLDKYPAQAARVPVEEWIYKPGLPESAPRPASDAFARVEAEAKRWLKGEIAPAKIQTAAWSTQEWLHFLKSLPEDLGSARMSELDRAFRLTSSGNSEIAFQWLLMAIRNRYEAAYPKLEEFLTTIGRRKFIRPLYEELMKTPEGRERARSIYRRARAGYHPIAVAMIDEIVK